MKSMQANKQRASRGSQDMDAKRAGQAEQCYLRGHALRKQGKLTEAAGAFSATLELAPTHFKALFNRAFVLDRVCPQPAADGSMHALMLRVCIGDGAIDAPLLHLWIILLIPSGSRCTVLHCAHCANPTQQPGHRCGTDELRLPAADGAASASSGGLLSSGGYPAWQCAGPV